MPDKKMFAFTRRTKTARIIPGQNKGRFLLMKTSKLLASATVVAGLSLAAFNVSAG
jgi:hypothetical protein